MLCALCVLAVDSATGLVNEPEIEFLEGAELEIGDVEPGIVEIRGRRYRNHSEPCRVSGLYARRGVLDGHALNGFDTKAASGRAVDRGIRFTFRLVRRAARHLEDAVERLRGTHHPGLLV